MNTSPSAHDAIDEAPQGAESLWRWTAAAYVCVGIALALVLGLTGWGATRNFADTRAALLQSEINRQRSHAVRTTARIRDYVSENSSSDLRSLGQEEWFERTFSSELPGRETRLYAALVDEDGYVIFHSDPAKVGQRLSHGWNARPLPELGEDVVETTDAALSDGEDVYDIATPIISGSKEIATYHVGVGFDWFERELAAVNAPVKVRWAVVMVLMLIVVLTASWSLHRLVRRTVLLQQSIQLFRVRQLAELGQLAAAIAHEIRNPLNAIRLNLHVLRKVQPGNDGDASEAGAIIDETDREIERVENLMKVMLGYARPAAARSERMDVLTEVQSIMGFLGPVMERGEVAIKVRSEASAPLLVEFDRARFRQIMLNLLNNSREAVRAGGKVSVNVAKDGDQAVIEVEDDGPGVAENLRHRIFEPFFSTKDLGTGLGLALVKRFVEDQGGTISCTVRSDPGAVFVIRLPLCRAPLPTVSHRVGAVGE